MTEKQWLASEDPAAMLRLYTSDEMPCLRRLTRRSCKSRGRRRHVTEAEWLACVNPAEMLGAITGRAEGPHAGGIASPRKLRLFAVAYWRHHARLLLPGPQNALLAACDLAERWADAGEPSAEPEERYRYIPTFLPAARAAVSTAACPAGWRRPGGEDFADKAAQSQRSFLRDIFGNPHRPVTLTAVRVGGNMGLPQPACPRLTPTVFALARAAYDEPLPGGLLDPVRLAILADALEEAGCEEESLLRHLRGFEVCRSRMLPTPEEAEYGGGVYWCPGCDGTEGGNPDAYWQHSDAPHVRGCWALDLILGKS